jgi:hypothetical protein
MQTLIIIVVLQLAITVLTGCSQLENKLIENKDTQSKLICQPVDSTGCIGWTK